MRRSIPRVSWSSACCSWPYQHRAAGTSSRLASTRHGLLPAGADSARDEVVNRQCAPTARQQEQQNRTPYGDLGLSD
jgi:hypothetical protein